MQWPLDTVLDVDHGNSATAAGQHESKALQIVIAHDECYLGSGALQYPAENPLEREQAGSITGNSSPAKKLRVQTTLDKPLLRLGKLRYLEFPIDLLRA